MQPHDRRRSAVRALEALTEDLHWPRCNEVASTRTEAPRSGLARQRSRDRPDANTNAMHKIMSVISAYLALAPPVADPMRSACACDRAL